MTLSIYIWNSQIKIAGGQLTYLFCVLSVVPCCKLEDFLNAGEINAAPSEHPEVHSKVKGLFEELGEMWVKDEKRYDTYIAHTSCPFIVNNACTIYEIRPKGCQLFPRTIFGMQTKDCPPLTRFKNQCTVLRKGQAYKETYHFIGKTIGLTHHFESIKPVLFTEKQYQSCITKLCRAGMTGKELRLFNGFNKKEKNG